MSSAHVITRDRDLLDLAETLSKETRICFDVETISYNDRIKALDPWSGHRIAGLALSLGDGRAWYVSVRHREPDEPTVSKEAYLLFCLGLFCPTDDALKDREVFGHNVKFDLKFLAADDIIPTCRVADTMILARLVDNSLPRLKLDYLCEAFGIPGKAGNEIKAFLSAFVWTDELGIQHRRSEDYGRIPLRIIAPYAIQDVRATYQLRKCLEGRLADFSRPLWQTEKRLTAVLAQTERDGVYVNRTRLSRDWVDILTRMGAVQDQINTVAGWKVNLGSEPDRTALFGQMGIKPSRFTKKTKKPQWNKIALEELEIPTGGDPRAKTVAKLLKEYSHLQHFAGTYLEGWIKRVDPNGYLHADLKQAGTVTGRLSAGDPNTQNIPPAAERYVLCPEGHALVIFDFSQIEYRTLAHYTEDTQIKGAYLQSPDTDFHEWMATILGGVPRKFAKTMNFGVVYGMGEAKMIAALVNLAHDPELGEGIRALAAARGMSIERLAATIFAEYHDRFPSIRGFTAKVGKVARERKWVRNLFGRRYNFDPSKAQSYGQKRAFGPHKAVNYIIQGSCADMLRRKLIELNDACRAKYGAKLCMTVHDSVFYYVPRENAAAFYVEAKQILQNVPEISVPIFVDGKVATKNAATYVKIDEKGGRFATIDDINRALVESESAPEVGGDLIDVDVEEEELEEAST